MPRPEDDVVPSDKASWPLLTAWKPVQLKPQLLKLKGLLLPPLPHPYPLTLLTTFNNGATRGLAVQQRPQLGAPDLVSVMMVGFYF